MKFRKHQKGLTLLELMIYSAIFVIISGLLGGIFYTVSKSKLKWDAKNEVNQNLNRIREILQQEIENAVSINSISTTTLSLNIADSNKTPTIFSLTSGNLYLKEGSGNYLILNSEKIKISELTFTNTPPSTVGISLINHWARNQTRGYIDFNPTFGNIRIPIGSGDLTGKAYNSGTGWISLNCLNTDDCSTNSYKVSSDDSGNLLGWASSEYDGWISFSCTTGGTSPPGSNVCGTDNYGVTVDPSTGEFSGKAKNATIGYIYFNCLTNNECATYNYKVQDLRQQTTAIKIDLTLTYNSSNINQQVSQSDSFVINLKNPSNVLITGINPDNGANTGSVNITSVTGSNFQNGAVVKLVKVSSPDIYASTNFTFTSSSQLSDGAFDLTGAQKGVWDVYVINPDGQVGVLNGGFTVY